MVITQSVLAIALAVIIPVHRLKPPVEDTPPRVIKVPSKSRERLKHLSSSNSTTPPSSVPSTPRNTSYDYNAKVLIASHSRSESSSSSLRHEHADGSQHSLPKSGPTGDSSRLDYSITSPPTSPPTSCQTPYRPESRQKFRLSKLKPAWGEKRSDNQPTIHRCSSSPVLTSPVDPLSPTKKKPCLLMKKSSKNLRKIASVPSELGKFFLTVVCLLK